MCGVGCRWVGVLMSGPCTVRGFVCVGWGVDGLGW